MKRRIIKMSTFTKFKSQIKAAKTEEDIKCIYADAAKIINNEALYDKIIKECIKKELQIIA